MSKDGFLKTHLPTTEQDIHTPTTLQVGAKAFRVSLFQYLRAT